MGKLDTPYNSDIEESVTPVPKPHRGIPFHLRKKKVKAELHRLQALDIIEPVNNEPTP